jgi:hypothetical protein
MRVQNVGRNHSPTAILFRRSSETNYSGVPLANRFGTVAPHTRRSVYLSPHGRIVGMSDK